MPITAPPPELVPSVSRGPVGGQALRNIADLPGPAGWPVLGNLPQIKPAKLHLQLGRWAHEYGRYFQIRLGSRRILVVADHEAVAATLRDRPGVFRRTERLEAIGLEMGIKSGLFGVNGEVWKRQRRMVMAAFDPGHVKDYFPAMQVVAQVNPMMHFIRMSRAILLKGAEFGDVWRQLLALAVLGTTILGLSVSQYRKRAG